MGKKKKNKKPQKTAEVKQPKTAASSSVAEISADVPAEPAEIPVAEQTAPSAISVHFPEDFPGLTPDASESPEEPAQPEEPETRKELKRPRTPEQHLTLSTDSRSRIRRMLPDILRVVLAFSVISIGIAIWVKPPLYNASFPITTFRYKGKVAQAATLYRPVAMQERYYVELPEKLENRYQWFAIDRRREEVALCEEPAHRFFGRKAIKRGDPLGLDLEFRNLDGSEWLIYFYTDSIVFSNNILTVRLDTK